LKCLPAPSTLPPFNLHALACGIRCFRSRSRAICMRRPIVVHSLMICSSDEPSGKKPNAPGLRALLQSIERHLTQTTRVTDQKAHAAQQLVFDAWEAPTDEEERDLIHRALELDPTNVDALLQETVYAGLHGEKEIEILRKVVAIGEKNLGPVRSGQWKADAQTAANMVTPSASRKGLQPTSIVRFRYVSPLHGHISSQ